MALLHDVVEDTNTTYSDIRNVFNQRVADFVLEVTDDKEKSKERKALQIQNAKGLSYEAKLIRIADKICNVQDIQGKMLRLVL